MAQITAVRAPFSTIGVAAINAWEDLLPLIHFENRHCGLRAQKILLAWGGIVAA